MKQLLCAYTSHHQDVIVEHTFFVRDEHRTRSWDGQSPLDMQIDRVIATAAAYIEKVSGQVLRFQKLELSSQVLKSGECYYYFLVLFGRPWLDDPDAEKFVMTEVIITLDYQVIEPEVHHFQSEAEYQQYRVLRRLHHQLDTVEPTLLQRVNRLPMNKLWALETALWNFSDEADLAHWLNTHGLHSRKHK